VYVNIVVAVNFRYGCESRGSRCSVPHRSTHLHSLQRDLSTFRFLTHLIWTGHWVRFLSTFQFLTHLIWTGHWVRLLSTFQFLTHLIWTGHWVRRPLSYLFTCTQSTAVSGTCTWTWLLDDAVQVYSVPGSWWKRLHATRSPTSDDFLITAGSIIQVTQEAHGWIRFY